jgi:exopolysaccharide biosynthesis polyprenyl glycosylphosphotransferase
MSLMTSLKRGLMMEAFRVADLMVMLVAFGLALWVSAEIGSPHDPGGFLAMRIKVSNILLLAGLVAIWHAVFRALGLYRSRRMGLAVSEWWDVTKAVALGTLVLAGLALLAHWEAVDRTFLIVFFSTSLLATIALRTLMRLVLGEVRQRGRNLRNLVIVGTGPRGARLGAEIWKRPELGYLLLGYVDDQPAPPSPLHGHPEKLLGSLADLSRVLSESEVDELMVCLPMRSHYEQIAVIVETATERGIVVRMPADFFELHLAHADVDHLDQIPIVTLSTNTPPFKGLFLKRVMDVLGASAGLVLLSPLLLLIAAAVKLDSPGPVFFGQERVGLGRRRFRMWKFRTMVPDAEGKLGTLESQNEVQGAAFKLSHDPRVTRVGHVLRRLSLDELPQLFNVLAGEMSVVGPRPLPIRDVDRIESRWQERRFSMKPGLTCLWQVNGRHEISFDHWMELDLQYIDNWSTVLDVEILVKTLPAVLRGTGAS